MARYTEASSNESFDANRLNCSQMVDEILKQELQKTLVKDVSGDF